MIFRQLFDRETSTYTYLLADETTREALLIDPVREQVERDLQILEELGLKLVHTLETHVHADHIAGSGMLRQRVGSRSIMSEDAGAECADVMAKDSQEFEIGGIHIEARKTPGHTDGCISFVVNAEGEPTRAFTGDTLLIRGCGRTDFQAGDSKQLYESVHTKLFSLPDDTLVFPGHDYRGRAMSTIGEEKQHNPRLGGGRTLAEFQQIMAELNLAQPKHINEAVPANLSCGMPLQSASIPEAGWAPVERREDGVPEVTVAWTEETMGEYRLIDVRETEELSGELGHIEGIEHVPLATLGDALSAWRKDEPLVIVCRSGNRSGKAAAQLEEAGFSRVASMRGGMKEWRASASKDGDGSCG
ncbi:MAG: MBL fold metallo-hydrolase [Polyangiales bacterium]